MYVVFHFSLSVHPIQAAFLYLHIPHAMQMQLTRTIAFDLMRKGRIDILQRGEPIAIGSKTIKGPIRLRITKDSKRSPTTQSHSTRKRMRCDG